MDDRDVKQIAEDTAERVLAEAFDRVGLATNGRPDWQAMSSLVASWKRREAWKRSVIGAAIPFLVTASLLWLAGVLRIGEWISGLIGKNGPPQ